MNQDQKYKKFKISGELIENIIKLIDESNDSKIVNNFKDFHHADIAEVLEELSSDQATYIIKLLDSEKTSDVLIIGDSYAKDLVNAIYEARTREPGATNLLELPRAFLAHVLHRVSEFRHLMCSDALLTMISYSRL